MFSLRICRLALSLSALLCTSVSAQRKPFFTSPLPTGVRLDPAGEGVELGSLPINLVLTPEKDRAVVVLSGWREQGVQVVDLKTRKVTQTLLQDGAFYGAAFSPDGHRLCVSGGNTDMLFVYAWKDGAATLENKFELAKAKTGDGTGTSYPAGLAFSPNGKFVYVAEDVGDRLAVVNAATGEITQRFSTDHYPYSVTAHCRRSSVRLGLGRQHGVAVPRSGGRNARVSRPDRSRSASVRAGGEGIQSVCHARG